MKNVIVTVLKPITRSGVTRGRDPFVDGDRRSACGPTNHASEHHNLNVTPAEGSPS
jgi:hypothetical protein